MTVDDSFYPIYHHDKILSQSTPFSAFIRCEKFELISYFLYNVRENPLGFLVVWGIGKSEREGLFVNVQVTLPDIFIGYEIWGFSENFEKNPHIFVPQNSKMLQFN